MIGTSIGYVIFPMLTKKENFDMRSLLSFTGIGILLILVLFIAFGDLINSIAFNGKFDAYRTPLVDLMIILIGALQFINGLLHWFILGLATKENIVNYLKVIITIIIFYFALIISAAHFSVKDFIVVIPVILFIWFVKVILTFYFIKKINLFK